MKPLGHGLGVDNGGNGFRHIFKIKRLMGDFHFSLINFGHIQHIIDQHH